MAKKVIITSDEKLDNKVTAVFPGSIPDVIITPLSVAHRLAIKFLKVYLTALAGFTGAGLLSVVPGTMPDPSTFNNFLETFELAAKLALIPAISTVLANAAIFFTKLDEKMPELMA